MAVLLQMKEAYKSYGHQVLLDGANLTLTDEVKVGFVGRNGAGKSTLLRILLEEEELDAGEVSRHPALRVGYLRQHDPFLPHESALDFLMRDSDQPDWKCGEVAGEFELKGAYLDGPVSALSGGWQTRVKLAALLLHDPNLLILDEPTNFLDLRTQILLEHFLRAFPKACLIVSHDRGFLGSTCDETLSLSRGRLTMFPGKIDAFLEHEQERRAHDERVNAAVLTKKKQLQKFIDKNRARASTASQARSKSKQLERLTLREIESDERTANIRAPRVEARQGPAVRCLDMTIGYPSHEVARDIQIEIDHGQRAAIVGDNGQGKTTLLRTLVGSLACLHGHARWGYGCEIATYAQHVYSSLPEHQTVLEYLEYRAIPGTTNQDILAQAGALLFRDEHVRKKVAVLSGGERARLCLAGILLGQYNVLVLDEPGNHLDVETVESLAEALKEYRGTVIFTSHDRHFMQRVATSVIEVRDGSVRHYSGGYEAYLYAVHQEIDEGERERHLRGNPHSTAGKSTPHRTTNSPATPGKVDSGKTAPGKRASAKNMTEADRIGHRDQRRLRKEVNNLEKRIAQLDDQKRLLNAQLMEATDPEEAIRLHEELEALSLQLEEAEGRWFELQQQDGGDLA